jgi:aldehyde:ferredoxin oxidoreductase
MANGYMGKILEVDLTSSTIRDSPVDEKVLRKYLGGKSLGLYFIQKDLMEAKAKGKDPKNLDPFGSENTVVFATGPGTGVAGFPSPGRYHVMASRSPLTGSIGSANSGGSWGPYLKFAGYDAIIIRGKSSKPVYLLVTDTDRKILDASEIWGKNVFDTTHYMSEKHGKQIHTACIGPAGENKVLMACIMNEDHRAAGRTGLGAVLGSKMLKAIAVGGAKKVEIAKPEEFKVVAEESRTKMKNDGVTGTGLPTFGTGVLVNIINTTGAFPTRNFQESQFDKAESISSEEMNKTGILRSKNACWGCIIACGRNTQVLTGPYQIFNTEGPEYETMWALGAACGVSDLSAVVKANHFCDEFGMDPITLGSTIACAMELNEKGFIPKEDLQGMDLKFGNAAAMVESVSRTAHKMGFGKYLALGSKKLAEKYGHPEFSMTVKGMEMPAYDPRGVQGIGLNYATSNRGGCHVTGYTISPEVLAHPQALDPTVTKDKATWVKIFQDLTTTVNSTVNCLFTTFAIGAPDYAKLLSAVTGWNLTPEEILLIGERGYNLERTIINKYGFDGKSDTLPARLLNDPIPAGPKKGMVNKLPEMLKEYYQLRGWENGIPTQKKLDELGIIRL